MKLIDDFPFKDDDRLIVNLPTELKFLKYDFPEFRIEMFFDADLFNFAVEYSKVKPVLTAVAECNVNCLINIHPYNLLEYHIIDGKIYENVPKITDEYVTLIKPTIEQANAVRILSKI